MPVLNVLCYWVFCLMVGWFMVFNATFIFFWSCVFNGRNTMDNEYLLEETRYKNQPAVNEPNCIL